MRKAVITVVTLVLFAGISAPSVALADDDDNDSSWSDPFTGGQDDNTPAPIKNKNHKPGKDNKVRHNEIEHLFEDITGVIIPPLVIRPGSRPDPNIFQLPVGPDPDADTDLNQLGADSQAVDAVTDTLTGVNDSAQDFVTTPLLMQSALSSNLPINKRINPNKHKPVQIKNLVLTDKTPTDEFMQDATVFGGVLGATAIGLLALAGFNTLRLRRDPKANYIYEAKD